MENFKGQFGYALCDEDADYLTVSTDIYDIYRYIVDNEIRGDRGEYIREGIFDESNLIHDFEECTDVDMN
ncbi:MAG TPA: hypothetical protein DEP65_02640, partial [Ruminococcus sp.]|nr:hypothetical protein [Ruminococcus sp.]